VPKRLLRPDVHAAFRPARRAKSTVSNPLKDEESICRNPNLDAAARCRDVRAKVADITSAVQCGIRVEGFAPCAIRQPRRIGLNDVAIEEWLITKARNDEQLVAARGPSKRDDAIGTEGVDDVDLPGASRGMTPAEPDHVLVRTKHPRAQAGTVARQVFTVIHE